MCYVAGTKCGQCRSDVWWIRNWVTSIGWGSERSSRVGIWELGTWCVCILVLVCARDDIVAVCVQETV